MVDNEKSKSMLDSFKEVANKVAEKSTLAVNDAKSSAIQIKDDAKKKHLAIKERVEERVRLEDIKKYNPIFKEDVENGELLDERVIRIVNYDARLENKTCKDSIGYYEKSKDRKLPTIYSKYMSMLGFSFYPQKSESVFIRDPKIAGKYIEIDEYYNYMKQVRVNELTVLAQALGAKSVNIELKSASKSFFKQKLNASANSGKVYGTDVKNEKKRRRSKSIEIWATATFKDSMWNSVPVVPDLLYFSDESDIAALIQMVVVNKTKLEKRVYSMHASSSSGMSLNEAASIVTTLKSIKCNAGGNFMKSAENQNDAMLEYTIDFF